VIMLYALKKALPLIDLTQVSLCAVINPDEESGSNESGPVIIENAKNSFAALSFEPCGMDNHLTCARKGVYNVSIRCTGIPGHAGAQYKQCASAIQALCAHITKLYTMRDDEHDISFNAGLINGGTAINAVAPSAQADCEVRFFNPDYEQTTKARVLEICAEEPVKGVKTEVSFGASHPAVDINAKSQVLLDKALALAAQMNLSYSTVRTGGAGDIAIAAKANIGVLDGLGMNGGGMHTVKEFAVISNMDEKIEFASRLILEVIK